MLIPFPIAFLVGAFVFDVLGTLFDNPSFWTTGAYLAIGGIVMGLVAAVPGVIDYLYSVPPNSSGKQRAKRHMLVNVTALVLFAVAWGIRGSADAQPGVLVFLLEIIGLIPLGTGGWLGGTLVDRNFIGPEHRYAHAGKWKEESVEAVPGKPLRVAGADELQMNQMKLIHVGDRRLVLGRGEDGYFAFDDSCTHRGGSLADGIMICNTVQCLWHGSQFDVRNGAVKAGPAKDGISTYRVEVTDGAVHLIL
jgi:Ferredoxin subunits of nitrite reductase and ring-hydroxylating dioxygenases